ncbi:BamA/TamA family outer membrane protein [Myxococcota bacterium]
MAQVPQWSPFEFAAIQAAAGTRQVELESSPNAKRIESIEVVTLDVVGANDPFPEFLNVFHAKTLPRVIRRELLFAQGQRYHQDLVDESARNLRALPQLSLVLIVPVRTFREDWVRVLVITRDVWSLKVNAYFEASYRFPDKLNVMALSLQPSEINLGGLHTTAALLFTLDPASYSVGGSLSVPRVAGSRIHTRLAGNLILNRQTSRPEGSFGSLVHGQPLYSLGARWAWGVLVAWRSDVARSYVGDQLRTYDATATPRDDHIPLMYQRDVWFAEYQLTNSFGRDIKADMSFGFDWHWRQSDAGELSAYEPIAVQEFRREEVPRSDARVSPFAQMRVHGTRYLRTLNLDTLGLQEDYQLGPDATLRVYPASEHLGSSRSLLGALSALSYTVPLGDGLARAIVACTAELAGPRRSDVLFEGLGHLITPRLGLGRLSYRVRVAHRYQDYHRERFELGGDSSLRGYAMREFRGRDVLVSNLEYRTPPLEILSAQLGAVLFYDSGDAFDGWQALRPKHAAGVGFRALIPQLDRTVFRLDWGFPLDQNRRSWPGAMFATFGQAVPLRRIRRTGASDPLPSSNRSSMLSDQTRAVEGR